MNSPAVRRAALVLGVAAIAAALLSVGPVYEAIDRAMPLFTTRPLAGGAMFVFLAAVSAMLAFFSSAGGPVSGTIR
jgi:hypothetical protein